MAKTQVFPSDHRPLFVGVVGKKLALIEQGRRLESCLRLHEFRTRKVLMSSLELFLENLNINPDVEVRLNEVSLVLIDHYRGVAGRRAQGLTKPMDRHIEAVASSVGRYFGPEHAHQPIPPHLAVMVDKKVLKHSAASPR